MERQRLPKRPMPFRFCRCSERFFKIRKAEPRRIFLEQTKAAEHEPRGSLRRRTVFNFDKSGTEPALHGRGFSRR